MSSYCLSSTCLNGNCPGCKNGSKFCNDPRCYPNCPDCSDETETECLGGRKGWDWTLIIIIGVLALLVLILFYVMTRGKKSPRNKPTPEMYQPVYQEYSHELPQQQLQHEPQVQVTTYPSHEVPDARQNQYQKSEYQVPEYQKSEYQVPVPEIIAEMAEIPEITPEIPKFPEYDTNLDASLNVPETAYVPSNNISQSSFTTTIPNIPRASISSPANISVASARSIPVQGNKLNPDNGQINGFF